MFKLGLEEMIRKLNTRGSDRTISDYVLVHSLKSTYTNIDSTYSNKPVQLNSAGHGQKMFDILKKNNIGYTITHVFPNEVSAGNVHIIVDLVNV